MWKLKIAEYEVGKKTIMELIDQSSLAFDQREDLSKSLHSLSERNENDEVIHMQVYQSNYSIINFVFYT